MTAISASSTPDNLTGPVAPYLDAVRARLVSIAPPEGALMASALAQSLGAQGKLLRPTLTLLCALAAPGAETPAPLSEAHLETAAAAELIHIATLLHDDVLDDADLRRGRRTTRACFGNRAAILAGDYLLAQASRKLAMVGNVRVIALFSDVLADLCDGELEQSRASYDISASTWDSYRRKTLGKTASLFASCCQAPAFLNGLSMRDADNLRAYGEHLGIAFQVMDDLLDFVGTQDALGKPVMDDLRNGLITAPVLLALESSRGDELAGRLQQLFDALEKSDAPAEADDALLKIQTLLAQTGAFDRTRLYAQSLIDQAIDRLAFLPESEAKDALMAMARFTVSRAF